MDQIEDQEIATQNKINNGGKQRRKGNHLRSTYYHRSDTDKSAVVSAAESSAEEVSMDFSAELKNNAENGNESLTYPQFTASGNQKQEEEDTDSVYYFGYGPIVNPLVRQRRGFGAEVIPEANIQPAILYDHRLQFIEGGTANIIPCRGWDVKGVLIQFHSVEEFHQFHSFDLNYDIHDVSVSLINKTNLDPKHKNDSTAPFEGQAQQQAQQQAQAQCQQGHRSEGEGVVDKRGHESYGNSTGSNSCPDLDFDYISEGDEPDPNDVDEDEDDKDDYESSCPFAVTGGPSAEEEEEEKQRRHSILGVPICEKSIDLFGDGGGKKEDDAANVVHAMTFMNLSHRTASLAASSPCQHRFDSSQTSVAVSTRGSTCSTRTNTSTGGEGAVTCPLSVVGMPQERYLKLMTDGLRQYDIDEEYINDEIMVVAYVPKERDAIVSCQDNKGTKGIATTLITTNYRTFPVVKVKEKEKEPKEIGYNKYVMKLCGSSRSINMKHTLLGVKPQQQQQQQDFYFICGRKVLKLIPDPAVNNTVNGGDNTTTNEGGGPSVANNACVRWIKGLCHGKQDVTYLVYQTFFDPDNCQFVIEENDTITQEHTEWAEHTLLLYLQRGGLSAVQVYKLSPTDPGPSGTASRGTTPTTFSGHHSSMNRSSLMKTIRSSGSKHSITSTGSNGSGGGMMGHGSGGTHASSSSIRISAMNRMKSMKLSSSRNGLRSSNIGDDVISHGANNKTWGSSGSAQFQVPTTGSRTHHHRSPSEIPLRNNIGRDDISGSQLYHNHGGGEQQHGGGRISSLSSSSNSKMNLGLSLRKKLLSGLTRSSKK